jgi:DMSO/TMAO reductase YedYZ heme-binding membrane subunit
MADRIGARVGSTASSRARFEGWPLVAWSALALGATCALLLGIEGAGEEGLRTVIRATARTSLVLFLGAFVASSLRRLWRSELSAWLLRNRRQVGVSFAVSHALHLGAILALAARFPATFEPGAVTVVGGGLGYVLIAAMVATSSDAAVRRLGARRWKLLHRVGLWWLFLIFASNYLAAPFVDPRYAPAGLAVLAALGIRIAAAWKGRRA